MNCIYRLCMKCVASSPEQQYRHLTAAIDMLRLLKMELEGNGSNAFLNPEMLVRQKKQPQKNPQNPVFMTIRCNPNVLMYARVWYLVPFHLSLT